MSFQNHPIAYDFHGDKPFTLPFQVLKPSDIHIYLDLDTKTGKNTCGQNCNHCWFVNYQKVAAKSFGLLEGKAIKEALDREGYKVFARYVDSFSYNGDFMKVFGPAHNREFRQEADHKPTETMLRGDAWTSGRPLLADNYRELLDIAYDSGYGTISITYHGVLGPSLEVQDHALYPIKGVFPGASLEVVASRIEAYNRETSRDIRLNIGVTIGRHNHSRESLVRYAQYFNKMGVSTVRFNNFTDHGDRHPHLQLTDLEVIQLYKDLKWLHENVQMNFQLAVSEDLGSFGIEVMGFPSHVGQCQAGRQLFTVIPSQTKLLDETSAPKREQIGEIVACVNIFEPLLGRLIRTTKTSGVTYQLDFDYAAINEFTQLRLNGTYKNGCFAKELRLANPPELTVAAKNANKTNFRQLEAVP